MCNRTKDFSLQYWKALRYYWLEQGIGICMAYKVAGDGEGIPFPHPTLISSLYNASLIISNLFSLKPHLLNEGNSLWDALCVEVATVCFM